MSEAFQQPGFTRWFAVLFGLFGVLTAGRSLSRVLLGGECSRVATAAVGDSSFAAHGGHGWEA